MGITQLRPHWSAAATGRATPFFETKLLAVEIDRQPCVQVTVIPYLVVYIFA